METQPVTCPFAELLLSPFNTGRVPARLRVPLNERHLKGTEIPKQPKRPEVSAFYFCIFRSIFLRRLILSIPTGHLELVSQLKEWCVILPLNPVAFPFPHSSAQAATDLIIKQALYQLILPMQILSLLTSSAMLFGGRRLVTPDCVLCLLPMISSLSHDKLSICSQPHLSLASRCIFHQRL